MVAGAAVSLGDGIRSIAYIDTVRAAQQKKEDRHARTTFSDEHRAKALSRLSNQANSLS